MKKNIYLALIILIIAIIALIFIFNKGPKAQFDVSGEYIDEANANIKKIEDELKDNNIPYKIKKNKNSEIYSLMIISQDETLKTFTGFNINWKTKLSLNNKELAEMYGYSLDDILDKINKRLKQYYDEEVEEGLFDKNECDFECYKLYRSIYNIEENYALYVKNDKLYIYISFDNDSIMEDKKYFDNLNYDPYEIEA